MTGEPTWVPSRPGRAQMDWLTSAKLLLGSILADLFQFACRPGGEEAATDGIPCFFSFLFFSSRPPSLLPSSPHLLSCTFTADVQYCRTDKGSDPLSYCSSAGYRKDGKRKREQEFFFSFCAEGATVVWDYQQSLFLVYHPEDFWMWFFTFFIRYSLILRIFLDSGREGEYI